MSDMADVLAKHQWYDATSDNEDPATGCTGCDDWFGSEDALDDGTFAAHQAAALSAAGFGPVQEAREAAWGKGYGAGYVDCQLDLENGGAKMSRNPYRKASDDGS